MAIRSQGTLLKVAAATTFTTVGEILDFNGPSQTRPVIDKTNLASTAREKLVGIVDSGTMAFQVHCDFGDAGQDLVRGAFASGALMNWQVLIPAGVGASSSVATTIAFSGYVLTLPVQGAIDGLITQNFSVAITGLVTEAATT